MLVLKDLWSATLHLFYPHLCQGCGSDLLQNKDLLCTRCIHELPLTGFATWAGNPVEKYFWGRIPVQAAHSQFYFTKDTLIQHLIHQLKYKSNKAIGRLLGEMMAESLLLSGRFPSIDYLVPLPLFPEKEHRRGYNQAAVICEGMSVVMQVPVNNDLVVRRRSTETQTRKHRTERWQNVESSFALSRNDPSDGKHILLVDDVVTTGATLEACGRIILNEPGNRLSIATLAHAPK
ncbi:MAG: ComF family protein [Chitinophagaceae bacterium]|nr:ComF family protein [Chitinophagaceae bacterium]MBL0054914.1 ComF family protein [Chitinophagaceae bacterium]